MSEMDEFMETAIGILSEGMEVPRNKYRGSTMEDSKGEKHSVGKLSQYAAIGSGYVPATNTITTLPPDCYTLSLTMEGQVIFSPQKLTTDDLMRLPDSKSEEVISEVEKFWTLKQKFSDYGFSHKRGFLLWGPPGSGKSATVTLIINDMVKKGGLVIIADHPGTLARALLQLRSIESERPLVVVWEDIDTIINNYGESTVLSILDGEAQVENVVFIATTNYPERLDGRVINRPSRFDKIVKIGMPNAAARALYLKSKIKTTIIDDIDIVKATEGLSIAHLKEFIVSTHCQMNSVKETLDRLSRMKHTPKSDDSGGVIGL